ncbi:ABC transporter transmembrane domain-containing protein [Actinosynnema sp. ALI-1.44]|uniref:ABC transporter transmembrane domain-containing protein n=1 Tax=Actinosynnema sp. ALI-1.44 TaxID=1933779 RepID=UPI001EDB0961|nr:ABC transporter transmembrane domain-containing protein [Actinosynnema sp. ALI-1.44]
MLLPALGNTCLYYVAPLVVAQLAGHLAGGGTDVLSYVVVFAGLLVFAEFVWRIGIHCLSRVDGLGGENLSVLGMNALLAKDAAFFHDNFAGSLTKRVHSFAWRFTDIADTMSFNVVANFVPLGFASVVLWNYHPVLVLVLIGMITVTGFVVTPLVKRRQAIVDKREAAIARVSGHIADSLTNMETVRAFAAEHSEAVEHQARVREHRRLAIRSWDYANLRIDVVAAPLSVLTNVLGLYLAVKLGNLGVEGVVVAFAYFANATRIMFEFNQIYRRLESSLTEAAQFTELLLEPPTVLDPENPEKLRPPPPTCGSTTWSSRTRARRSCSPG